MYKCSYYWEIFNCVSIKNRALSIGFIFDLMLEENMTYEEKLVKGKYRITTEAYYGNE